MFAFTWRAAGQRARRRLPRSLQGLSTPNVKRGWGDMKDLTGEEKAELLHGAWRAATPVQLSPAAGSRDRDETTHTVSFTTEEAAQDYLDEESRDELAEARASTLALAQQFFVDLAATADAEVDAAAMPPAPQSDEERRREMRDVQREFYGDYYVEQGLVPAALRYAFVDAMLRPSRPLFLVNSVRPLARLTVRHQLEVHSSIRVHDSVDEAPTGSSPDGSLTASTSPVFAPTPFDACLYAIPLPPTQALGAPLHVPFSATTSAIGSNGADAATLLAPGGSAAGRDARHASEGRAKHAEASCAADAAPLIEDADALGRMMSMEALPAEDDLCDQVGATQSGTAAAVGALAPAPQVQPPRLEHVYWLQRQIACDALLNVDDVALLVSLLSIRLAAAAPLIAPASAEPLPPYELILYKAPSTTGEAANTCFYLTELAQYWFRAVQEEAGAGDATSSAAAARLQRVVIAVEDASIPHRVTEASNRAGAPGQRGRGRGAGSSSSPSLEASPLCEASTAPVADRFPNVVYLSPHAHPLRNRRRAPGRCRVVVCVPSTSQDGVRPRGWLDGGDATEDDMDVAGAPFTPEAPQKHTAARRRRGFRGAPPNTFVERCQTANSNFPHLQRQLYDAIGSAGLRCEAGRREGSNSVGYVVYATQSANVIENEAVVCAVLHRLAQEAAADLNALHGSGSRAQYVAPALCVECVPLDAPDLHASLASAEASIALRRLERHGRRGLDTWTAIEDGAAGQEPGTYGDALRGSVAAAAWRTDPMRSGSDGGFVVCLRVTRAAAADPARAEECSSSAPAAPGAPCVWWTHPGSRVVGAVTPATQRFLEDACGAGAAARSAAAAIVHAGVPCGLAPHAPLPSASVTDASGLLASVQLSSATCHVDVVAALRRSLPRLTLSAHALCEVLRRQEVHSRTLRRLLRQREKQSPRQRQGPADDAGHVDVAAETHRFLEAVEACCEAASASAAPREAPSRVYALLKVDAASLLVKGATVTGAAVTTRSNITGTAATAAAAAATALHPAVLAEVEAVGVVAEIEYAHRTNRGGAAAGRDFSLRLSAPPEMPERAKHTAAQQEWCVALRDALLYVLRRTGGASASAEPVRLWADASRDSVDAAALVDDGRGDAVRLPNAAEVLELASDEYEAAVPTPLQGHLHYTDGTPALPEAEDISDQRGDWMRDTNYREWRRRRGLQ